MKVLFVTPRLPYPPDQGAKIRNWRFAQAVARENEVHLLSLESPETGALVRSALSRICQRIETSAPPSRSPSDRIKGALSSPRPDTVLRHWATPLALKLQAMIEEERYSLIQFQGLEVGSYLEAASSAAKGTTILVLDDHNAEYMLHKRAFLVELGSPKRWYAGLYSFLQWRKLVAYERRLCELANAVITVCPEDCAALRRLVPGLAPVLIPNGVDLEQYRFRQPSETDSSRMIFVGSMDYRPNGDGALWFIEKALPLIQARVTGAEFWVVGPSPGPQIQEAARRHKQVVVTGRVEDVRPYLAMASLAVVPIRMGSGMRLKVLEAMAAGLPVVSTSQGVEGVGGAPGVHYLVGDSHEAMAEQAIQALTDTSLRLRIAQAGRELVGSFRWEDLTRRLLSLHRELVGT